MTEALRTWPKWTTLLRGAWVLFVAGCASSAASFAPLAPTIALAQVAHFSADHDLPVVLESPVTVEALVELASQRHPELAVARAKVEAARGKWIQAGLYPNPVLGPVFDELGHPENALGHAALEIHQTIVRGGKLELAKAAAGHGVQAADWHAVTRWHDVATRVRLAFFELLAAQRELDATGEIVRIADEALEVAKKLQKGGVGSEPDVLRAQVERDQNDIRKDAAQRRVESARRLVAAAVGVRDLPLDKLAGSLEAASPVYEWDIVRQAVLVRSSEILEAESLVQQAEESLKRAQAENVPNLEFKVKPFYAAPDRNTQVEVGLAAAIPIWNQNQGNILAAQAERDRARAEVKQVELRLSERLAVAFQRYQTARLQSDAYRKKIVPQAKKSVDLVEAGYKSGDAKYNYTALLQAQQVLFQAQLTHVQALGELWRAVAEIRGLLQEPQSSERKDGP